METGAANDKSYKMRMLQLHITGRMLLETEKKHILATH